MKNAKYKIFFLFAIFFMLPNFAEAFGSPNYLPDGPHPRILLNGDKLTQLMARKDANTAEWATFKSWLDAHLGENVNSGYQGAEWTKFLTNYSLGYRITGNTAYAAEALIYMNALLDNDVTSGSPIGSIGTFSGANAIKIDSGYSARLFGHAVPQARDWLDGYSGMDSTMISRINSRMADWINWYKVSGYQRSNPEDNYYGGFFSMVYAAAHALYGDPGYDPTWLTMSENMWTNEVLPIFNGRFKNCDTSEGFSYGGNYLFELLQYPAVRKYAAGDNLKWTGITFQDECVRSIIHQLHPNRVTTADDGVWDSNKVGWPDATGLLDLLADQAPLATPLADNARWYTRNITQPRNTITPFDDFFWNDPIATAIIPDSTSMQGLSWKTSGEFFSRSATWSNTNATWWSVTAWPGDNNEGTRNVGEFKIMSRGEQLLVDGSTGTYEGYTTNTLSATGPHRYAPWQDWENTNVNIVSASGDGYTCARVNNIEQAYDTQYYGATLAHYHRNILNIGADLFVVSDTAIPLATSTMTRRWHFLGSPASTTNTIRSNHTNGDLSVWSDGVVELPMAMSGYPYRNGTSRVDVGGDGLTVFEAGGSGFTAQSISQITGTNTKGVFIGNDKVAMFTASATGDNMTNLNYTVNTPAASTHYIADLNPNATYNISIDGGAATPQVSSVAGVISFINPVTGISQIQITSSSLDTTAPSAPTGLGVI